MYNNINTNSVIYCISNQIDPVLEFGKKVLESPSLLKYTYSDLKYCLCRQPTSFGASVSRC